MFDSISHRFSGFFPPLTLQNAVVRDSLLCCSCDCQCALFKSTVRIADNLYIDVTSAFKFQCLDKNNLVLLVVNHQMGLFQLVCNYSPEEYKNNVMVHASLGKVFNLPTISLLVRKLVSFLFPSTL